MARIRTIKPTFFRHRRLFLAEKETGLPLRVAFAGLWTVADREGRFRWEPEEIKLDCLPYDDVEFSEVLDALEAGGFIFRYEENGRIYGFIPSWADHQVINIREVQSNLPEPPDGACNARANTGAHVHARACTGAHVHAQGEGKGREGKGKERIGTRDTRPPVEDFNRFKKSYPQRGASNPWKPALISFGLAIDRGASADRIVAAADAYRRECDRLKITGTEKVAQAVTWLNEERYNDYSEAFELDEERRAELHALAEAKGYRLVEGTWVKPGAAA